MRQQQMELEAISHCLHNREILLHLLLPLPRLFELQRRPLLLLVLPLLHSPLHHPLLRLLPLKALPHPVSVVPVPDLQRMNSLLSHSMSQHSKANASKSSIPTMVQANQPNLHSNGHPTRSSSKKQMGQMPRDTNKVLFPI